MKQVKIFVLFFLILLTTNGAFADAPPSVEFFSPQGTVKGVRQVSVRFSEQMVPLGDPRALIEPFEINCPEKGTQRWADGKNWVYDFKTDLSPGLMCEFSLKPGIKSLAGRELSGKKVFSFSTGGPSIKSSYPYDGSDYIDEGQIFILDLDAEAEESSVLSKVFFAIEGISERVGVNLLKGEERDIILKTRYREIPSRPLIVIRAKQNFPARAKVVLVWGKGIETKTGIATEVDQTLNFKVREPFTAVFSCERENANSGCIPITPMRVSFSAQVSWELASKIVLKGPGKKMWKPLNGTAPDEGEENDEEGEGVMPPPTFGDFVSSISFQPPFPESGEFRIEMPSDFVDDAGRKLENADKYPLAVKTEDFPPLAKFAARFGIIELKANPSLPLTLRNVEPAVLGRVLSLNGGNNAISKAMELFDSVKGKIFKIDEDGKKESEILYWLDKVRRHENYYDGRERSIFSGLDNWKNEAFSIQKPNGPKAFEVVGIPFKEPGFYVVEVESAILGQSLLGKPQSMYVSAAALVTNMSAHFKWGMESSLVWVTTLDAGKPIKDALVTVRDCTGKAVWEGKTDADGIARTGKIPSSESLPYCSENEATRGYIITARQGNDMTFVLSRWSDGIEPWRFQLPEDYDRDPVIAHTVMDRSLLRAGETLHMKHLVRRHTMSGFSMMSKNDLPKAVLIEHSGSGQRYEFPLEWDFWVAETSWDIPKEAKLGHYNVFFLQKPSCDGDSDLYRPFARHAGSFRVEEFRVPLMKGVIQPITTKLISPKEVSADLAVKYLSGGGASNLKVKLRTQLQYKQVGFDDFEFFKFANGPVKPGIERRETERDELGESLNIRSFDLNLDEAGTTRAVIPDMPKLKAPMDLLAELEFRDPNGEVQTISSRIPLWPSKRLVGIKPDEWALSQESFKFHVAVVDISGKPVAGSPVRVDIFERKYYTHRKRLVGGFYAYENTQDIKHHGVFCEGKTDKKGLLICEAKSPVSGNVILQARTEDGEGNEIFANSEVWIAGKGDWWFEHGDSDRIDLLPEKKHYEPGEKARFQVRMPFKEASVLVTVEREGVIESFVRRITSKSPVIEVPIKGNYAPNVFVSALVVRGRVGGVQPTALVDLGRPAYKLGIAEINVGWKEHRLSVKVSADREAYKVREKAKVKVAVKTWNGKTPPRGSEIAIAAVDEGLLELMPNKSWDLLEAMMGRRSYEVQTSTAQMHIVGKRHFGLKALAQGGGGGRQTTRELFDTLLIWKGRVKLDENGEAIVEVPLNDSITSFRIVAVATGGAALFGTGSASIRTTQDLMIFSGVAPLVREADTYRSEFTLRNTTDRAMDVAVTGKVHGVSEVLKPEKISLRPGESKEIGWTIAAPYGVETLTYELEAIEAGGGVDRIRVKQKVTEAVPVRTFQATLTQVDKEYGITVERPKDAVHNRGGVKITLRPKLTEGLAGLVEYMKKYPYSCMEQKTSKAIALRDKAMWKDITEILPSYLDFNGFVKYFPTMYRGSDILTAYMLSISNEAGWEIPESQRNRMITALRNFVNGSVKIDSVLPAADLTIRKLAAIEALSRVTTVELSLLSSINIDPNIWPTSSVIDWKNILTRVQLPQRQERLAEAEQILRSRLNFQGTTMGFSTEREDNLWWLMVSTDLNSVRLILSVLESGKWKEDMPRLVRGALGRQRKGAWNLTTANAWGVLAFEKFSQVFEKEPVTGISGAILGGKTAIVDWADRKQEPIGFAWPSGREDLKITHSGSGKPWATVQSLAAIPLKEPFSSGYKIKKTLTPIEQKTPGVWNKGDIVRVRLEVEAQADMTWVVVDDPIPAGSTILGGGLGRDSQLATQDEIRSGCVCAAYEERSFEAFRSYYEYVPKGTFMVEYTLRLNQSGKYNLPQTRVEALYSPEMFGEIPNAGFEVK